MSTIQMPTNLGSRPVGKLLVQYALPAIIAITATSLYNLVDSVFIGQGVGPLGISALAVTFPLMNISAAFGTLVGIGGSTLLSIRLGEQQTVTAHRIVGNLMMLNVLWGVLLGVLCLCYMDPILQFFGATPAILPYARDYMEVLMWGNVVTHLYMGLNSVLRALGQPRRAMGATIFTVLINAILDPLFIWPLGMGIQGVALATVIGQLLALLYQLQIFSPTHGLVPLRMWIFRLSRRIVSDTFRIGLSPFLMNLMSCLVTTFVNHRLLLYGGELAIGAYGIINRVAYIFIMLNVGLNQGMQPIVGYNYGARQYARVWQVLRYAVVAATVSTTCGCLIGTWLPGLCAQLFTDDAQLIALVEEGMPLVVMCYFLVGSQMVITSWFQSIGRVRISIFLSLSRQLLFLLPLMGWMSVEYGLKGIWGSMAASDAAAWMVTLVILGVQLKKRMV